MIYGLHQRSQILVLILFLQSEREQSPGKTVGLLCVLDEKREKTFAGEDPPRGKAVWSKDVQISR